MEGGQPPAPCSEQALEGLVLLCALRCLYMCIYNINNMQIYMCMSSLWDIPFGPSVVGLILSTDTLRELGKG